MSKLTYPSPPKLVPVATLVEEPGDRVKPLLGRDVDRRPKTPHAKLQVLVASLWILVAQPHGVVDLQPLRET